MDVEVDHAGTTPAADPGGARDPLGELEARDRLVEPGHRRRAGEHCVDEALELEREADLGLVAGRLVRLASYRRRSSTVRRKVGGSSVAQAAWAR